MFRLVIADDEPDVRDDMIACIDWDANGIEIVGTADNGREALELIRREHPDLVLIDILMPEMSGLDVIAEIEKDAQISPAFIVVSGCDEFSYSHQALNLGVVSYILKPFMPDEMLSALRKAMHKTEVVSFMHRTQMPTLLGEIFSRSDGLSCPFYPAVLEHELITSLIDGDEKQTIAAADGFIEAIFTNNSTSTQILDCFLILYAEISRNLFEMGLSLKENPFVGSSYPQLQMKDIVRAALHSVCKEAVSLVAGVEGSGFAVKNAMAYIQKHYQEKISLERLASAVYVSPVYLSNLFSKTVGMTVSEYIQKVRIDHAKTLMRDPSLTIVEIADEVGYVDGKYFAQIFKKVTGRTPAQYRNQVKMNEAP